MPVNVQGDFGAWGKVWRGEGRKRKGWDPAVLVGVEAPYVHYGEPIDFTNGWVEMWICESGHTMRFTRQSPSHDGWVLQHLGIRDIPWDWGIPPWQDAPDSLWEVAEIWVRPQGVVTMTWSGDAVGISSEGWQWLL